MILLLLALVSPANAQPQAECTSAFGKTACGFHCVTGYGQVKCATVPWGACHAAYGQVVCGPDVPAAPGIATPLEKASCKAAYGKIACGYHCTAGYGQVKCAPQPSGACSAAFGEVTCTGQDPNLMIWMQQGVPVPPATCTSAFGRTACGWGCVAEHGAVVCSTNPWGACVVQNGKARCDVGSVVAPIGVQPASASPPPQADCLSAFGQTACGYHCKAGYGQVKCSSNPHGACKAAYGTIECF